MKHSSSIRKSFSWTISGQSKHRLSGHFGYVVDICWILPSSSLASASADGSIKIWDSVSGECKQTLQEGFGAVNSISLTKSGQFLASAGHDGNLYFWNLNSKNLVSSFEGQGRILVTEFNSSNNKIVITSYGSVTVLELSFHTSKWDKE